MFNSKKIIILFAILFSLSVFANAQTFRARLAEGQGIWGNSAIANSYAGSGHSL